MHHTQSITCTSLNVYVYRTSTNFGSTSNATDVADATDEKIDKNDFRLVCLCVA